MNTNIFLKRISNLITAIAQRNIFQFLNWMFNQRIALVMNLILVLGVGNVCGQTYYNMSSGNYTQDFADISNWTNNFTSGVGASNWSSVGIIGSGNSVTTGTRTTKSSATFVSSASGGIQKGTQSLVFLSTGSSATPEAVALDLLLNFSARTAGTLSFDWAAIDNGNGTRPTSLRVFWSIDGTNYTEITAAQVLDKISTTSGSISLVSLPIQFDNSSTARLRFYNHAGNTSGSGNRDKLQIDNISVTSTAAATNYTVTFNSNGGSGSMSNQTASTATNLTNNSFTRTGYTFAGWNTAANGSGTPYANGASFPFSANTTLYAQWTANTLNVTYDLQGGAGISNGTTTTGASLSNPGSPTRSLYNFDGWFTASSGGAPVTFPYAHGQTSNFTLFAQWTLASSNNCPSGVSVSPTADQDSCENATLKLISANPSYSGGTGTPTVQYQWYYNTTNSNTISGATSVSGATNASFTPPSTSSDVGTRYYFCVAYAVDNSCAQSSTTQSLASITVKVVVNGIPAAPTGAASQSMCLGQTVSNLNATGTTIKWYSAASGGSALNSSLSLSSTDYYASQTVNGCESSNRLAVAVAVNAIPSAPSGNASQTFCSGNTVSNLNATGTAIKWYSASSGGSALTGTSALSSINYFATQTINGCESSNRLQVAATVNTISTPTNIVASNANCSSFDLAWNAVNCASGYKLDVASNSFLTTVNQTLINNSGLINSSGWTETNITQASGYISMLSNSSSMITPVLDLSNAVNSSLNFKIRTFGGTSGSSNVLTVSISIDNGLTWSSLGTKTATSSTLTSVTSINLSSYISSQTRLRFQTLNATGSIGIGIDDILIDKEIYSPNYLSGYQDLSVSSTSKTVSGLSPNTKYYYRVRSTDGTNTSANSNVDSFTTPALSLTTSGTVSPICFNVANASSLSYTAATDNPNSYSIDWNTTANTAGLTDQTATSFTSSTSGGTISSIAIPSNIVAGTYNGVMTITNAAGCSIIKNLSLTINPLPTISISASPANAITCLGSSVTLTATAGLSSYAWSSGASTTNTAAFSPTATNTYSVTGTDGNGCINSASQTVNYYPASSYVGLSTSNVSGAVEQCTESNGWTYYALPSNPSQYLFGIHKNGNTFTATVDITLDNINKHRKSTSSNGANQEHASYIMSRYWNATLSSGSIASNSSVKVRFFIDPQDTTDLKNARDNDYNTLKNTTNPSTLAVKSSFEWFKTVGTIYAPTNWLGNTHNGTIVKLTQDATGSLNGQTYVELSGITSFSGGSGGAAFGPTSNGLFNNAGVVGLPVTWHKVDVQTLENGNEVVWSTSSEQNTSHFEVEYSDDAVQFYKVSENIPAAGNSSATQYYKFLHESEMKPWLYYRVKQVDLDGKVDFSKIVIAKRASKLPDFKVLIYPIPLIEGDLTLDIHSIAQTELQIRIIDLLGKEVHREKVPSKGYRTQHQLQLNHVPKGSYQIQVDNSVFSHQQRLVLLK